jgi:hypothetical protein
MIQIANTQDRDDGNSDLACYVLDRLPASYRISRDDIKWLDVCGDYLDGEPTNQSVLAATKKAFQIHEYAFHIDPFELLIDANICDTKCEAKE